jgi:hypothetical protein
MLQNPTFTIDVDGPGSGIQALGGTFNLYGDSAQGVSTSVSGGTVDGDGYQVTAPTVTVTVQNATTTAKGVASFNTNHFTVSAGAVSLDATIGDLTNVAAAADSAANNDLLRYNGSAWTAASPAAVAGTINLGDLADVGTATPTDGHALIGDGTAWNNQKIFHVYTGSSATTHTVTHNIGQQFCNVTVIDDSTGTKEVIIPQSIVFDSVNQLTVTLNSALAIKVVVMGVA